jgi:heterodisulfide reductase subunit A
MVNLMIDGKEIAAEEGRTVLEVARQAGIEIPALCHHESLPPYGACRFCIVEVTQKNRTRLVSSCTLPVSSGQQIQTASEKVMRFRRMLAELMLARYPTSKPIREIAAKVGVRESRFEKLRDEDEKQTDGACVFVDEGGCILCGMCVRLCDDVLRIGALGFEGRGSHRRVTTPFGQPAEVCMTCGACSFVCPTGAIEHRRILDRKPGTIPSEFEEGLASRSPIYIPFPQAVPRVAVIDRNNCMHFKTGGCNVCEDNCQMKAIDHNQQDQILECEVGNIILATGCKLFDCRKLPQYGYGRLANVYTSLEFERLCNASGPTGGKIVLRDGKTEPQSVAIIHCVGSRDVNHREYCSAVCCMAALKFGHLVLEKTDAKVYAFYIDMRTYHKGYEEFYQRLHEEGMHFIRGRVAEVTNAAREPSEDGKLIVQADDTLMGKQRRFPVDMVILMGALEPQEDADELARKCGISCGMAGWYLERHPKLDPVATMTDGIFVAGACQGPKDIPDSVAQGAGAAARVQGMIAKGYVTIEPITSSIDETRCAGCLTCQGLCPYHAIEYDGEERVCRVNAVLCKGCGTCVAACPSGAATATHYTDEQIYAEIDGVLCETDTPPDRLGGGRPDRQRRLAPTTSTT